MIDRYIDADTDIVRRLQKLADEVLGALRGYASLAEEITDPTADLVMRLIIRDAEHHSTMLLRITESVLVALKATDAGAAEVGCFAMNCNRTVETLNALSRAARARSQWLRDLACSERGLDRAPLAMVLDALAADSDKHARLLAELGRHLTRADRKHVWRDAR